METSARYDLLAHRHTEGDQQPAALVIARQVPEFAMLPGMNTKYESDFYAWAQQNAALLRSGQLSQIDVEYWPE